MSSNSSPMQAFQMALELENPHAKTVFFSFSVLSLSIGPFFNALAFVVFTRKCFRQTTMTFFYCWLLVFDTAVILAGVEFLVAAVAHDPKVDSHSTCRFLAFAIRFVGQCSAWFEVLLTADRFLSIIFPNRFKFNKSVTSLFMILLVMIGVLFLVNLISFWFTIRLIQADVEARQPNRTLLVPSCRGVTKEVHLARELLALFSLIILPILIMSVLNFRLLRSVFESKKSFRILKRASDDSTRKEVQFAVSVLSLTILFIVFNIPLGVVSGIQNVYAFFELQQSSSLRVTLEILYAWSRSLAMFYHAMPFFINLKFNHLFRQQLLQLVSELSGAHALNRTSQTTTTISKVQNQSNNFKY